MTLTKFFESTPEEERRTKNLRDNRKERIDVNEEECQLRRGNREQNAANLHKESKVASHKKVLLAFACSPNVLQLLAAASEHGAAMQEGKKRTIRNRKTLH